MGKRGTTEMKEEAVRLYCDGVATRSIALQLNVDVSTVYNWIGGEVRTRKQPPVKNVPIAQSACRQPNSVFALGARA